MEEDIDYMGIDLNNGCDLPKESAEECLEECYKFPGCKGFTWINPSGLDGWCPKGCWLKDKMGNRMYKKNCVSSLLGNNNSACMILFVYKIKSSIHGNSDITTEVT